MIFQSVFIEAQQSDKDSNTTANQINSNSNSNSNIARDKNSSR